MGVRISKVGEHREIRIKVETPLENLGWWNDIEKFVM
jgi:hypothetical protein